MTLARFALGSAALSMCFGSLFGQVDLSRPDVNSTHLPAYRLRGGSLATLQSIPLPARTGGSPYGLSRTNDKAAGQPGPETESVKSRVLVAFQDGLAPNEKQAILDRASGELQLSQDSASSFFDIVRISGDEMTVNDAISRLRSDPRVRIAEPDYIVHTMDKVPNDSYFRYLWGLRNTGQGPYNPSGACKTCSKPGADISAVKAWDLTTGSSEVVVGVIDTGVDYTHPDLAANILRDGSGKIVGYDYVNKDDDPMDDFGHGTHCAGIIGAVGNNATGVAGVSWNVKIMPLKFMSSSGSGSTSDAVSCIDYAIAHGANVLSNSWGGPGFSQLLLDAVRRAEKAGILFVAAAGNSGVDLDSAPSYPASFNQYESNVISVAATDYFDVLASFSNYGSKTCDIAAPGVYIYSTLPSPTARCALCADSGYGYLSGTSMAAPHVAGAAALVKARFPDASLTELRARLVYSGDHPVEMEGYTRGGRLNVYNSIQSDTVSPGPPLDFSITKASGTGLRLTWTASGEDYLTGTVSGYQVFYNTTPDLSTATIVEANLKPGPPGTKETFDLIGLVPNSTYYIGLRAVDKVGNTSPLVSTAPVLTDHVALFDGAESAPLFGASGGDLPWAATADEAHSGSHSYVSAPTLLLNQKSTLQMTDIYRVNGPSYLSFWAKTDLDYGIEYLYASVLDMDTGLTDQQYLGTGSSDWARYRYDLVTHAGHRIRVGFYTLKGSSSTGQSSHRAWVDDITIVQLTGVWEDNVESTPQFTGFPPWSITSETSASPSHSWSDSPDSKYAGNVRLPLMQNSSVVPPDSLGSLSLVFKAKIDLEPERDFLEVYASSDDGTTWSYLSSLTGTADWTTYSYNLPGWKKVRVLFYLVSNGVLARDGVHVDDIGVWGESFTDAIAATQGQKQTSVVMPLSAGGAGTSVTSGGSRAVQSGYATLDVGSGVTPYATAVLSYTQGNVVVSETAVGASAPTTAARIFVDYRTGVASAPAASGTGTVDINTGLALVNRGSAIANIIYVLRDAAGTLLAASSGTLSPGVQAAKFIHQLQEVAPNFKLPADFATAIRFGSLEIVSSQPLSITALRLTTNQRGDLLLTTTPVADLTLSANSAPLYFPQFADGAGYTTAIILMNTSGVLETGTISLSGDDGSPVPVTTDTGTKGPAFEYSIQSGGVYVFQTNGASAEVLAGSARVTPSQGTSSPIGLGVIGYSSGGIKVTESGVPSAIPTTRARIFIDQSQGHDTGLAIASADASGSKVSFKAYQTDGSTVAGVAGDPISLPGNGHLARFVGQLVSGLQADFTGVLDISAPGPFAALTLRSLKNARGDILLTTCPIANLLLPAPTPAVFPQLADGGGYLTQFILLGTDTPSSATIRFYSQSGIPLPVGK